MLNHLVLVALYEIDDILVDGLKDIAFQVMIRLPESASLCCLLKRAQIPESITEFASKCLRHPVEITESVLQPVTTSAPADF
jgi:hypothetical protein